jgi:hypothetical protein
VRKCWLLVLLIRAASLLTLLPVSWVRSCDMWPLPTVALLQSAGACLVCAGLFATGVVQRRELWSTWDGRVQEVFDHHSAVFSQWARCTGMSVAGLWVA